MSRLSPQQEIIERRHIALQYELDKLSGDSVSGLQRALDRATRNITQRIAELPPGDDLEDRLNRVLDEVDRLTGATRERLTNTLTDIGVDAGTKANDAHNRITSFDGLADNHNDVRLSPGKLRAVIKDVPVGGLLLKEWVDRIFDGATDAIRAEIAAGLLEGAGLKIIVDRLEAEFKNMTRRELVTLTRTYVQSVNSHAMNEVYKANKKIIKKVEWSAITENGSAITGRGLCIRCAGLDGRRYDVGKAPYQPLHPRCRCTLLPVTVSWKDLGIDMPEAEKLKRKYLIREPGSIDTGEKRRILSMQKYDSYDDFLRANSDKMTREMLGPRRAELYKRGLVKDVSSLVDKDGNLKLLKDLPQLTH